VCVCVPYSMMICVVGIKKVDMTHELQLLHFGKCFLNGSWKMAALVGYNQIQTNFHINPKCFQQVAVN